MKPIGFLVLLFFLILGCNKNDDGPNSCSNAGNCDDCIVINKDLYNQTNTDNYTIKKVSVNDDCLEIKFASSGCDGHTWGIDLIDEGGIAETVVPQRNLKLKLTNREECDAVITRTISFNLKALQLTNYKAINLKIVGYNNLIRYEY